jgi:hypothetical protein
MRRPLAQSLAALAVVALAACGSDKDKNKLDKYKASPSPTTAGSGAAPPAAAPPPAAPPPPPAPPPKAEPEAAPAPAAGALPPPTTALPRKCNEYRAAIERLAQCGEALPKETQEALKAQFDNQWAGWHKLPDQDRDHLAGICDRAAASVKAAAGKACGW